jgi:uncharacterized protein (DUF736 family)
MIIGNFKKTDEGNLRGVIRTFTIDREVELVAVAEKKGEKSPDYRLTTGHTDIGVGRKDTSGASNVYLSVRLDDPALPAGISCALVKTTTAQLGCALVWDRPNPKRNAPATAAAGNNF